MPSRKTGFVLGKIMPLHRGHEALLRFARLFCDDLAVVVDRVKEPWVSGEKRCEWVRRTVPDADVFYLPRENPQDPSEHPDFWRIWQESLLALLPRRPDYVFASEPYGAKLAEVLGASFVPFDIGRETVPVSGTMLRDDLLAHWDYLSDAAKRDYTMRVCVFGPESTGKSTLARELAAHYKTVSVPEYARFFIEAKRDVVAADMPHIARGQAALERLMLPQARRMLFADTGVLATEIWTRWLFDRADDAVARIAGENLCDFYLLLQPDIPWVGDAVRYFEGRGDAFFDDCKNVLEKRGCNYAVIGGAGPARLDAAIDAVDRAAAAFFTARRL
jgi:NadR type nicotinamide-nucleotide adenylyltransferase